MSELEINPCTRFTTDAIGKPGQRTFFLRGESSKKSITLIYEKVQLQSLILEIVRFFDHLHAHFPYLSVENGSYIESQMRIEPPLDPLFRIATLKLSYKKETDLICLTVTEQLFIQEQTAEDEEDARTVKYWCSRDQISQFLNWSMEVINRGRPICPLCSQPIEPEGHLCPKKNGHKKT